LLAIRSTDESHRGWDNTGANGANLSFPVEFGIENREWLIGVINAGPTLFGLLSAWAADPVNNFLGRRGTIFFTNLFVVFPVLAQAFTQNWWGLLLCRLCKSFGDSEYLVEIC
jgi:MFS family permease